MVQRSKPQKKRQVDPYRKLARELRDYTVRDYSKKRKLTPADKGALTKAANLVSSATFVRVARKPNEKDRAYKARVKELQRQNNSPVSNTISGLMVRAPADAVKARIVRGSVMWELPPLRTKKQGRSKVTTRLRTGYKIPGRRHPDYDPSEPIDADSNPKYRPMSERVRAGIRDELVAAMKGMKRPVEMTARVGHRLNATPRVIYKPGDAKFEALLEEILHRLEFYQIRGFLVIEARSI